MIIEEIISIDYPFEYFIWFKGEHILENVSPSFFDESRVFTPQQFVTFVTNSINALSVPLLTLQTSGQRLYPKGDSRNGVLENKLIFHHQASFLVIPSLNGYETKSTSSTEICCRLTFDSIELLSETRVGSFYFSGNQKYQYYYPYRLKLRLTINYGRPFLTSNWGVFNFLEEAPFNKTIPLFDSTLFDLKSIYTKEYLRNYVIDNSFLIGFSSLFNDYQTTDTFDSRSLFIGKTVSVLINYTPVFYDWFVFFLKNIEKETVFFLEKSINGLSFYYFLGFLNQLNIPSTQDNRFLIWRNLINQYTLINPSQAYHGLTEFFNGRFGTRNIPYANFSYYQMDINSFYKANNFTESSLQALLMDEITTPFYKTIEHFVAFPSSMLVNGFACVMVFLLVREPKSIDEILDSEMQVTTNIKSNNSFIGTNDTYFNVFYSEGSFEPLYSLKNIKIKDYLFFYFFTGYASIHDFENNEYIFRYRNLDDGYSYENKGNYFRLRFQLEKNYDFYNFRNIFNIKERFIGLMFDNIFFCRSSSSYGVFNKIFRTIYLNNNGENGGYNGENEGYLTSYKDFRLDMSNVSNYKNGQYFLNDFRNRSYALIQIPYEKVYEIKPTTQGFWQSLFNNHLAMNISYNEWVYRKSNLLSRLLNYRCGEIALMRTNLLSIYKSHSNDLVTLETNYRLSTFKPFLKTVYSILSSTNHPLLDRYTNNRMTFSFNNEEPIAPNNVFSIQANKMNELYQLLSYIYPYGSNMFHTSASDVSNDFLCYSLSKYQQSDLVYAFGLNGSQYTTVRNPTINHAPNVFRPLNKPKLASYTLEERISLLVDLPPNFKFSTLATKNGIVMYYHVKFIFQYFNLLNNVPKVIIKSDIPFNPTYLEIKKGDVLLADHFIQIEQGVNQVLNDIKSFFDYVKSL